MSSYGKDKGKSVLVTGDALWQQRNVNAGLRI